MPEFIFISFTNSGLDFSLSPTKNTFQKLKKKIQTENINIERCIVIDWKNIILIYILTSMPS